MGQLITIHEGNWKEFIGDGSQVVANGEVRLLAQQPRSSNPEHWYACSGPAIKLIPESEWKERIAYNDANGMWVRNHMDRDTVPCLDQDGTPLCWINSTTNTIMAWRAVRGYKMVHLAPESALQAANGGSIRGGTLDESLRGVAHGMCSVEFQSGKNATRGWKPGWEEDAAKHRGMVWTRLGSQDMRAEVVSCALQGIPIISNHNWWMHSVMGAAYLKIDSRGKITFGIRNSWGAGWSDNGYGDLAEGRGVPDDAAALIDINPSNT